MSKAWNAYRMTPATAPLEANHEGPSDDATLFGGVAAVALFAAGFVCCWFYGPNATFPGTVEMTEARKVQEWVRKPSGTTDYWRIDYVRENGDVERAEVWPCFVRHNVNVTLAGKVGVNHGWIADTYTVYVAE